MLRLRTHAWICLAFFLGLLALGWGGAMLAGSGVAAPTGAWRWFYLGLLFVLMLGLAFSAVPVMVLLVTGFQARIGSPLAGLAKPRWQNIFVYVLWALMALGSAIAIPAAFLLGGFDDFAGPYDPGASRGTLVARPGMSIAEVKRASTLPIDAPDITHAIGEGVVFDFEIAGTGIRLPRCRYYFASTYSEDRQHIEGMSIGVSTSKLTRAQAEAADAVLQRALAADGWLSGHEEYRTEEDRALHGGAERGPEGNIWLKGDIVLNFERKRMDDPQPGEDAATAGEFIQVISLWARKDYSSLERFEFTAPTPR